MMEYICYVGLAQIANTDKSDHIQDRDYVLLGIMYSFGVFISRSSMVISKIKYFGIMALLQFGNVVLWSFHCRYNLFSEYAQYGLMFYVGLLGGIFLLIFFCFFSFVDI